PLWRPGAGSVRSRPAARAARAAIRYRRPAACATLPALAPRDSPRRPSMSAAERVAYFNGRIVPETEVRVSFRDRGFKLGDAVFDTTRTFGHRVFKLREHVDRLYRSLRYLQIDPG